jgi:hypothetical protein
MEYPNGGLPGLYNHQSLDIKQSWSVEVFGGSPPSGATTTTTHDRVEEVALAMTTTEAVTANATATASVSAHPVLALVFAMFDDGALATEIFRHGAAESGGARMLMRASVEDTLRRIEWFNGSGCCASGVGLIGSEGSERYEGGSASRYARRRAMRRPSMRMAFIFAVREDRTMD